MKSRSFSLNLVIAFLFLGLVFYSGRETGFSPSSFADSGNLNAVSRFVAGLWPPETSSGFLRVTGRLVAETFEISLLGTVLAVLMGFPLSIAATRPRGEESGRPSRGLLLWAMRYLSYHAARIFLNILRGIPELMWALIFVVAVGLGPFPGVLALAAHSAGVLGKLYSEIFESVDDRLVEMVRSTGAGELAVLAFARIPATLPVFLSYTLFRWECNMRAATVLGFVGAGGIGTQLMISMKLFAYGEVLTLVATIFMLVFIVDLAGQLIRANVLGDRKVKCGSS
ncbi:MAG: phosphonate ABC transporter, permease protein PhnE [Bacillota bacterium]